MPAADGARAPSPPRCEGVAVPGWFKEESMRVFRSMDLFGDDVVLMSLPKCGTTWTHAVLYALLHTDARGEFAPGAKGAIGSDGQVYPDALPVERPTQPDPKAHWGMTTLGDLIAQPRPRLFSTHCPRGMLPTRLAERGRLIFTTRNPKDALVSYAHFVKKLASQPHNADDEFMQQRARGGVEAMYKNFNKWPKEECPQPFGSWYDCMRQMGELLAELGDRATVVYYEQMQEDFAGEVARLGAFLGVPMSPEKVAAVVRFASFDSMTKRDKPSVTLRKGVVGDYAAHLTPAHWAGMDRMFDARVGDVAIARPLRRWMGVRAAL